MSPLTLATWNVRPLLANPRSNRPGRKTALVVLELARHKVDIAALNETGSPNKTNWRSSEIARRLTNFPVAAATAADENASVENRWCQLRDTAQSTALAVLDHARRQHRDWFDDGAAISNLLAQKNRLHNAYVNCPTDDNKAAFYRSRRSVQQRLREMLDSLQGRGDPRIKTVYCPPTKATAHLLSADRSTLLTEKTQILQRWAEHFRGDFNRSSTIYDAAIARLPQVETNADLDLPPSLHETIKVGPDAISAEIYKHRDVASRRSPAGLQGRRNRAPLQAEREPPALRNHRGISLLNIRGKVFARIFLNRLNHQLEQSLLPGSQCGFRRHLGTTNMIFATSQLQENCQEMRTYLYSTFLDLTKAVKTVNREGLWKIIQKFGCLERFTQMVRQLHDGSLAWVTDNGAVSEAFAMTNGVKQGCVLAPTLSSLMFSAMQMDAYRDECPRI
ncbi:hypothetical protein SprV_0200794400 [Sparganum proliferum]